ncbi:MAG: glycosyltransferase family protein [Bacteroidia bacterium]
MKSIKYAFIIFTCIFLLKVLTVFYLVSLTKCIAPTSIVGIASMSGDASSYITPIDNYINEGNYYFESARAGRMPYVGLVYYPFRLLFSKPIALGILVILQIFMESIAIYYIAKLCANLFKNYMAFWIFIFLSVISLYVTIFDLYVMSESFGISFVCLFAYNYYTYLSDNRTNKQLLITGIFLALSVLFKPIFSLIFLLVGIELIFYHRHNIKSDLKKIISCALLISLPLIILNAPWTIRNYILLNKFIPFQQDIYAGYNPSPAELAEVNFISTIGESYVFWDKRSAGCYFEPKEGLDCEYQFPSRIFSTTLTLSKIEEARATYLEYKKYPSDSLEKLSVNKFNDLSDMYKKEHLFSYYCLTPIMLCKNFLFHSGSYYLPIKMGSACYQPYQWVLKLFQSLMYYLTLLVGFIGLVILLRKNPKSFALIHDMTN